MGYFIGYRHTGADPDRLEQLLPAVRDAIESSGEDAYCTYFDEEKFQRSGYRPNDIMQHAFEKIDSLGGLFVVMDGPDKSEGMLIEAGYCLAKNIVFIVAKRSGVSTYLDQLTVKSFEYNDVEDLVQKIGETL